MHMDSMDQGLAVPHGFVVCVCEESRPLTNHVGTEGPQDLGHLLVCRMSENKGGSPKTHHLT